MGLRCRVLAVLGRQSLSLGWGGPCAVVDPETARQRTHAPWLHSRSAPRRHRVLHRGWDSCRDPALGARLRFPRGNAASVVAAVFAPPPACNNPILCNVNKGPLCRCQLSLPMPLCLPALVTIPGALLALGAIDKERKHKVVVREEEKDEDKPSWWEQIQWWWNHPTELGGSMKGSKAALTSTKSMIAASNKNVIAASPAAAASADSAASAEAQPKWSVQSQVQDLGKILRFRGQNENVA